VSIAMAYGMMSTYGKQNRSLSAAAGVLRGYNSSYPLSDLEKRHLRLLIACRLSCSITLGAFSFQKNPENTYLLLHSEPAWQCLELIWPYDEDRRKKIGHAMDRLIEQACLHSCPHAKEIRCYDLVIPDPDIADLLEDVRIKSFSDAMEPPRKKQKTEPGSEKVTSHEGPRQVA